MPGSIVTALDVPLMVYPVPLEDPGQALAPAGMQGVGGKVSGSGGGQVVSGCTGV